MPRGKKVSSEQIIAKLREAEVDPVYGLVPPTGTMFGATTLSPTAPAMVGRFGC